MNYWDFVHERSHAVIEAALGAGAASGMTREATLAGLSEAASPFDPRVHWAQRIWHDELDHRMSENRRHTDAARRKT